MPPGPPTFPIVGNIPIFPKERFHLEFTEWSQKYGDVISIKLMNQSFIVLNTPSAVKEAIDKRSMSSSNRPKSTVSQGIIPDGTNFGTSRHGDHVPLRSYMYSLYYSSADETWRVLRKLAAQLLSHENFKQFAQLQLAEANQLMLEFALDPDDWYYHIHRYTTSFAMTIIYGLRVPCTKSRKVSDFLHVHHKYLHALEIGTLPPIDLFPILNLVPERWAKWKQVIREIRGLHEDFYGNLLKIVQERVRNGRSNGSFMEDVISKAEILGIDNEEVLMNLGAVLLQGSDTSSAAMQNLVLCLVAFPEAQAKAREEIDRVIGKERAPKWDDITNLPYTKALVEECNRFRPVGPLGLPHAMVHDEIINGQLYPKDSVLFINLWGIFHDERYFDRPDAFEPERFLETPYGTKKGISDDPGRRSNMMFGGGRRVCPGIAFAQSSMEINAVNLIWGFELLPAIDPASGKELFPTLDDYSTGVTATPKPTKIRILPRSSKHLKIIQESFVESRNLFASYEQEISEEDIKYVQKYVIEPEM